MRTAIMADRNTTIDYIGRPNVNDRGGDWPTSVGMAAQQDHGQETQIPKGRLISLAEAQSCRSFADRA
jgi:hypothetical protein